MQLIGIVQASNINGRPVLFEQWEQLLLFHFFGISYSLVFGQEVKIKILHEKINTVDYFITNLYIRSIK